MAVSTRADAGDLKVRSLTIGDDTGTERVRAYVEDGEAILQLVSNQSSVSLTAGEFGASLDFTFANQDRAHLMVDDEMARLVLRDPEGHTRATITARTPHGSITLHDPEGNVQVAITSEPNQIAMRDSAGEVWIVIEQT